MNEPADAGRTFVGRSYALFQSTLKLRNFYKHNERALLLTYPLFVCIYAQENEHFMTL